jgi:hypothetical protein
MRVLSRFAIERLSLLGLPEDMEIVGVQEQRVSLEEFNFAQAGRNEK